MPTPQFVVPSQLSVTSDSELEALKKISETKKVDELIATVSAHKIEANVNDLVQLYPLEFPHTDNTSWTMQLLLATSSISVAMVMFYCARTHLSTLLKCCTNKESPSAQIHSTQNSPPQVTTSPSEAPAADALPSMSSTSQDFASYAILQN